MNPSIEGLGARTLALRPSARRRLRRRMLAPFMNTDAHCWHNTTRGVRLFVGAAFSGLDPHRLTGRADDRVVSALFVFGAIRLGAGLGRLSCFAQRRAELAFLRRAYEMGPIESRRRRRALQREATTPRGRVALREGQLALVEWFRGTDPSLRLRELIENTPGDRLRRAPGHRTQPPLRRRDPAPARVQLQL